MICLTKSLSKKLKKHMKKPELIVLAISLSITCAISVLLGFAGSAIVGTFWAWFWIGCLFQLLVFVGINSFLIQKDNAIQQQNALLEFETFSKFTVSLTCGYCQQNNVVPIQLNQRNTFKCESCNQTNSVSMQFTAIPVTTPIESVKIPVENSNSIEFKVSA